MSFIICSDTEIMVARALTVNSYNTDGWQMESGRSAFNWLFFFSTWAGIWQTVAMHWKRVPNELIATEFDMSAHSVIPSFVARNK